MSLLDGSPLYFILSICVLLQVLFIEIGFRYGLFRKGKPNKSQMAQVRAIMGASLGLLAFMLAFTFGTAQHHFEGRTAAYMMEVSAIDSAFRGTDLIGKDAGAEAKKLLVDFTKLRLQTSRAVKNADMETAIKRVRESEQIHDRLWAIAQAATGSATGTEDTGIFAESVLAMITAHDTRLQTAFFNRISPIIWVVLFLMALLSMLVMGYQAGLTGTRSSLATWTIAITFAAVMTLIADLDRPSMTLFQMNEQLMVELENRMDMKQHHLR